VLIIFLNRSRTAEDRYLRARTALMCVGAGLGLGGMLLDIAWLIWLALAILLAGVALRLVRPPGEGEDQGEKEAL
jgi:hypothetical protein